MDRRLFNGLNNYSSTITAGVSAVDTSCTVATFSTLPSPVAGEYFYLTFSGQVGNTPEIVKVTARASGALTIARAQDGTTAQAWSANALIEAYITDGDLEQFAQGADNTGNAKGTNALDVQSGRTGVTRVASGTQATAIGYDNLASASSTTAVGTGNTASGNNSVAVGRNNTASASGAVAVGSAANVTTVDAIAIGNGATATNGANGVALGRAAVSSNDSVAVGSGASTGTNSNATAVGKGTAVTAASGTVVGINSSVAAAGGTVVGPNASITSAGTSAVVVGDSASASANQAAAIGTFATSRVEKMTNEAGTNIIRNHDGDWSGSSDELFAYAGRETIVFGKDITLTAAAADDVVAITIPSGARFYVDEVGIIIGTSNTVTVNPQVSFGITGNTVALLAQTAITAVAQYNRTRFQTPVSIHGQGSLTFSVKVAASATALVGRPYFKGICVEV